MNNFNKKAVFAALMGVLSSVSSFASEKKIGEIDNANLCLKRQIRNNLEFLDKKTYSDDTLKEIFENLAKIKYDNFDGGFYTYGDKNHVVPLNAGFVRQRNKRNAIKKRLLSPKNYGDIIKVYGKPKDWNFKSITLKPLYDLEDKYGLRVLIKVTSSEYYTNFKNGRNNFLICLNENGFVDGFVQFAYLNKEKTQIKISMLANAPEKNGIGIGKQMVKLLQEQYTYIALTPNDDNAQCFYEKLNFKSVGKFNMFWKK